MKVTSDTVNPLSLYPKLLSYQFNIHISVCDVLKLRFAVAILLSAPKHKNLTLEGGYTVSNYAFIIECAIILVGLYLVGERCSYTGRERVCITPNECCSQ